MANKKNQVGWKSKFQRANGMWPFLSFIQNRSSCLQEEEEERESVGIATITGFKGLCAFCIV